MKERQKKMIAENSANFLRRLRKSLSLDGITNLLLLPVMIALLSRVPFFSLPDNKFTFFIGAVVFWYILVERSFKANHFFRLHRSYRYTVFMIVSIGVFVNSFISVVVPSDFSMVITPIFLGTATVTILVGYEVGIATGLFMAYLSAFSVGNIESFVIFSTIALVSTLTTRNILRRINIARAGFETGIIFALILFARSFFEVKLSLLQLVISFFNPVFSAIIVIGILPYIEYASRIYSNIGLLELGNLSHPLLKSLSLSAPGTYQHSVSIANLAEIAAEEIGANPILARVAAYFHDIGKSKRPQYFTENQRGLNPHESLSPSMSNLVINEHVKLGVELARKYRLPILVEDVIREHHGTRIKKYFYHKAKTSGEDNPDSFRYPGPKPRFKESGIIMLADSVEAAFKSLKDPTPGKIQELVEEVVNGIYNERQLDKSGLNLEDLEKIIEAFTRVLISMSQARIEYPKEKVEKVVRINENNHK